MEVGVRELKAKLSGYLEQVQRGSAIVVTDRGRPVARLVPLAGSDAIARGIEEGWIDAPRRTRLTPAGDRVRGREAIAAVLDEDRG